PTAGTTPTPPARCACAAAWIRPPSEAPLAAPPRSSVELRSSERLTRSLGKLRCEEPPTQRPEAPLAAPPRSSVELRSSERLTRSLGESRCEEPPTQRRRPAGRNTQRRTRTAARRGGRARRRGRRAGGLSPSPACRASRRTRTGRRG